MYGNAPKALWSRWSEADSLNRIELACRALLIEGPDYKILCETGIGAFFEPKFAERYGVQNPEEHLLLAKLKELGIEQNDITYVVLSHLHFDHAGGLLPKYRDIINGDDNLLFPKAKYIMGKEAFMRSKNPHPRDKASFIPLLSDKLHDAMDRCIFVERGTTFDMFDGRMSFFFSDGHTPGQMLTIFRGDKETVFFCGDLVPGSAWLHTPITMGYDRFPELLIDEKMALYKRALPENWLMFYTHDPKVSASRCKKDEKGRVIADDIQGDLNRYII
ncbi:MAG: MBL fold metallo-hydrolase [Oligoflexales bacterium]